MIDINSETSGLDQQHNRRILDVALGHLFPLEAGPQNRTLRHILKQLRRENEASVSLARLIDRMHEAPKGSPPA